MSRPPSRSRLRKEQFKRARTLLNTHYDAGRAAWRDRAVIPLDEPVFGGYERSFVVRPDLTAIPALHRVLDIIQRVERSHRRDFARRDYRRGSKKVPQPHEPRTLTERAYHHLPLDLQHHFKLVHEHTRYGLHAFYAVRHEWKFVSRISRYYYTHRTLPNSEAESLRERTRRHLFGPSEYTYRHVARHIGDSYRDRYDMGVPDFYAPLDADAIEVWTKHDLDVLFTGDD